MSSKPALFSTMQQCNSDSIGPGPTILGLSVATASNAGRPLKQLGLYYDYDEIPCLVAVGQWLQLQQVPPVTSCMVSPARAQA